MIKNYPRRLPSQGSFLNTLHRTTHTHTRFLKLFNIYFYFIKVVFRIIVAIITGDPGFDSQA